MGRVTIENNVLYLTKGQGLGMRKRNILLVDGDESVEETLKDLLKSDCDCITVQNSDEGLLYLEKNAGELDLIIIDFPVPADKELEMLTRIENNSVYRNIPVLIIASLEQTEDIANVFDIGADDIISKPLNPDIVKKRVENMLRTGSNRMVHNVMEDLIRAEIDEYIDNLGICTCPICRRDLLTLTLNNVQPKYVTSEKGAAITKAERIASREEKIKLLTEITYCAQMVKKRPHHG